MHSAILTYSGAEVSSSDSLKIQVYKRLRFDLMTGRYEPGEKITIHKLAKEFGTSPTPVREALLMLVQENSLEMKAASSCRVPELSVRRYKEIRQLRIELQSLAAREAMKHIDITETAELLGHAHENFMNCLGNKDIPGMLDYNERFGMILTRQSQMPILISLIETLWMQAGPVINLIFRVNTPTFIGPHPHLIIIAGVKRNNPDTVCQAIRDLLTDGGNFVINELQKRGASEE